MFSVVILPSPFMVCVGTVSYTHLDVYKRQFHPTPSLLSLKKDDLKALSREDYNRIFAHSAVKRAKYEGLLRTIQYLKD